MDSTATWTSSPYWGTFWGQFFIELTGGLLGALIFLFIVLFLFKPKIRIAPFLIRINSENENPYYIFKFVNSSFFSAHDLKVELFKIVRIPMGGGESNNAHYKLAISNGDISQLPPRLPFWRNNMAHPHCMVVRTFDDINSILSEELNGILLRVSLKHGLTGLSNVFEQEYANETDIKVGKFRPGKKFALK